MEDPTEATPKTPTRTTRSSSSQNALQSPSPPKLTINPTSISDLLFTEQPISLQDLLSTFPGRKPQILDLLRLIGPPNSPMTPLFLYGGPSSGKTSLTLTVFRHLNRPFVYSSCRSCYSPRILFESVLNQLLLHRRNNDNGYSSAKRCDKVSDFVVFLRDALVQVIAGIKNGFSKVNSKRLEMGKRGNGDMIYLIFDNIELIRDWDKSCNVISVLFKMYDLLKMKEVGLIFISNSSLDTFYSNTGFVEPLPVFFPDYTENDLYRIFMRNQANPKLYSAFLDAVLKPFCRITRRVDELAIALLPLFRKYCEPLHDLGLVPDETTKRRLFSHLQPYITSSLNQVFKITSQPFSKTHKDKMGRKVVSSLGSGKGADELDFHMSVSAKYLLISAFLASRNPATLDAAMFDSTGGSDNRKRRRKSSETSIEKKDNTAQELLMKGPGTFPLERLLAIFQCIISVADGSLEEEEEKYGLETNGGNIGLMSDVLLQLSTLCNANFISKGASCPLEGSIRYRSTVDEEMALKVARSINFPLSKYLYRR